jgi:hypothetical protein
MADDRMGDVAGGEAPPHHVIVLPFLKAIGQRFIMADWLAITIARWIFAWRKLDDIELAHELAHVRQWRQHGFFGFIVKYWRDSSAAQAKGLDRYRDNAFEVEARAAEDEARARRG